MLKFFGKQKEATVSKAVHEAAMEDWRAAFQEQCNEADRLHGELVGLERAIASLKPDALAYRARLKRDREYHAKRRANLKQFRDKGVA